MGMSTETMIGLDCSGVQPWPINDGCEKGTQDMLELISWRKEEGRVPRKGSSILRENE